jgi:twitching motility protein PilT
VEDPIEYVHTNKKSLIHQRELYTDVQTFDGAVRAALREDPDVMLIGEMRDVETIRAAITAAETGHLVFSTLHTGDCVGAIDRMIGVFSAEEQLAIRQQLSMVLRAVVAQHLLPVADGDGRVPLAEVMFVTSAVANLIRTSKPSQIYSLMEIGSSEGMLTADFALAELVYRNQIREEDGRRLARDPAAMVSRLQRLRGGVTPGSGYGIQL